MNPSFAGFPTAIATPASLLSAKQQGRERRWSHRAPCLLRLLDPGGETAFEVRGETVNMSANGLAVQVSEPVPEGWFVETVIAHKSAQEAIVLRGKVVHSRRVLAGSFEVGVRTEQANLSSVE
ncbi:MAG: PilZ domain-containing protein [Planctomycetes bacterium]|nr:PilZ domain-containing protein [Planctomycetota bacterium]